MRKTRDANPIMSRLQRLGFIVLNRSFFPACPTFSHQIFDCRIFWKHLRERCSWGLMCRMNQWIREKKSGELIQQIYLSNVESSTHGEYWDISQYSYLRKSLQMESKFLFLRETWRTNPNPSPTVRVCPCANSGDFEENGHIHKMTFFCSETNLTG